LELESLGAWHYQEGSMPTCRKKTLKKSKFNAAKAGCKKLFFLIAPILFLYYEESVPIAFELQQGLSCVFTNGQT
jgi:hypothetical protein